MAVLKTGTVVGGHVVWHAGNDGDGSTLDADTVDGLHASELSLNGHNHDADYLDISGTAVAATKLATARTITLGGDVTGSTTFDGTANKTITAAVVNDSHTHGDSTINGLNASATTAGTFALARIPTGNTGTDVALGDHEHAGTTQEVYLDTSDPGTVGVEMVWADPDQVLTAGTYLDQTTADGLYVDLAGDTMQGNLDFATNSIIDVWDVKTQGLSGYNNGDIQVGNAFDMNGNAAYGVPTPTNADWVSPKSYVDESVVVVSATQPPGNPTLWVDTS